MIMIQVKKIIKKIMMIKINKVIFFNYKLYFKVFKTYDIVLKDKQEFNFGAMLLDLDEAKLI
jgi:hypothetical protein